MANPVGSPNFSVQLVPVACSYDLDLGLWAFKYFYRQTSV